MAELILTETFSNGLAVLSIDKPKALNAADVAMVAAIRAAMAKWKEDASIRAVLLKGNGGKAFSSGADVKGCREALVADSTSSVPKEQVFEEYNLIYEMRTYPKPTIAVLDGVTMGFGLGLGCSATLRIATEKTRLAMPENNIGLFPDVAFAYVATQMPRGIGRLMALTGGHLLGAGDALASGLATHYVPAEKLPDLLSAVCAADITAEAGAEAALRSHVEGAAMSPEPGKIAANAPLLETFAAASSLAEAFAALDAEGNTWAAELKAGLAKGCPFSQSVAWALLLAAEAEVDLPEPGRLAVALERDWATACRVFYRPDFCEGVRAVLVDKGSTAAWQPPSLPEVNDEEVKGAVADLPEGERRLGLSKL